MRHMSQPTVLKVVAPIKRDRDRLLPRARPRKWSLQAIAAVALYLGVCIAALTLLPLHVWGEDALHLIAITGFIGTWRFSWWLTHLVRAQMYERRVFPPMRAKASALWESGWRPDKLHVLMTTFRERRDTAEAVVRGICSEIRSAGRPAIVWIGSAEAADEQTLVNHFKLVGSDLDIQLRIIRQQQPGKRVALSLLFRAVAREGLGADDIVAVMDGDFILEPGALTRCLPLFQLNPDLHAVTTDEDVIVIGPQWLQSWLSLRFAQRRIGMQSHALSGRVLTLTGRYSVFRATHITRESFIRLIEADHLHHWLWGSFRFLSGDDKSTWFGLLQQGVTMLYVPDARGTTIEVIEGSGVQRMVDNLRRWSGNVLRNGWRAIQLGPRRMPPFIWWCLVDQRIAIWTTLLGPLLAITGALRIGVAFIAVYAIYVALTRLMLALVLFAYSPRVDLNYIWCLYANQLVNAGVKLYTMWRLPQQKWANRGNQKAGLGVSGFVHVARRGVAAYLTTLSIVSLALAASIWTNLLPAPRFGLMFLFERWLS
jgi:mannuronan synthase